MTVTVVGIGAEGWPGLGEPARRALQDADVVLGAPRQLALLPPLSASHATWPTPLMPALPGLLAEHAGRALVVLASGDPTFYGIGSAVLAARPVGGRPPGAVVARAGVRAPGLGRAGRRGALDGRPAAGGAPGRAGPPPAPARPGAGRRRPEDAGRVAHVVGLRRRDDDGARIPRRAGGEPDRRPRRGLGPPAGRPAGRRGRDVPGPPEDPLLGRAPGLPDDAYSHDGQLTKAEVRALSVAALRPVPGALLWDVGGGAGSVGIEWMRHHPACRARRSRCGRIARPASAPTP